MACGEASPAPDVARLAQHAFGKWLRAGGVPTVPLIPDRQGPRDERPDVKAIRQGDARLCDKRTVVAWEEVERALAQRGYTLALREPSPDTALPFVLNADVLPIYEVRSSTGDVVAEGKGLDREQARRSALGEAVERVVAGSEEFSRSRVGALATPRELLRSRFSLPEIACGPRDLYSPDLYVDWIASHTFDGHCSWAPAEAVFPRHPPAAGVSALNQCHTTGLAAGATVGEAFSNALLEVLERDAYWITMRCRRSCPEVAPSEFRRLDTRLRQALDRLRDLGVSVHARWISLDWPIPIAITVLADERNRMPAFSKGTGAALTPTAALTRSLIEALQMHSDLGNIASDDWEKIIQIEGVMDHPPWAWCDPCFGIHLHHLTAGGTPIKGWPAPAVAEHRVTSIRELCDTLQRNGYLGHWTHLGSLATLDVVRVTVDRTVPPDYRLERIGDRLLRCSGGPAGLHWDPILT